MNVLKFRFFILSEKINIYNLNQITGPTNPISKQSVFISRRLFTLLCVASAMNTTPLMAEETPLPYVEAVTVKLQQCRLCL